MAILGLESPEDIVCLLVRSAALTHEGSCCGGTKTDRDLLGDWVVDNVVSFVVITITSAPGFWLEISVPVLVLGDTDVTEGTGKNIQWDEEFSITLLSHVFVRSVLKSLLSGWSPLSIVITPRSSVLFFTPWVSNQNKLLSIVLSSTENSVSMGSNKTI